MSTIQEDKMMDLLVHRQAAMDKAKIGLMSKSDSAFFVTVCFSLKHLWDETIPTAATNGTYIKFNTAFFMSLSPEERIFLLIHESMHVAYLHMARLMGRNHQKYNIAADHVINLMLIARKFKMPSMGLADPQYTGMHTEEVYDLLPDPDPNKEHDCDIQEGEGTPEEVQSQIEDILIRASIQSKMQDDAPGTIPGEIEVFLKGLLDPKLPWNRILHKYLLNMSKSDYSMRKPNRRFFPKYHLPSLYSETLMDLDIAVDISGSVSDHDFHVFISEVHCIFKTMKPGKITLIQFDTEIHNVDQITSLQELSKLKFTGRGGTDIRPVIQMANERKPKLLMIFSDGGFHHYDATTKVPVVWLIHNNANFTAPYGKVIHYEI